MSDPSEQQRAAPRLRPLTDRAGVAPSAVAWRLLFGAWLVAAAATASSLFFSAVMELPPCVLCWYQRIALFPLVLVLLVGLHTLDRNVARYGLSLAIAGWLVSAYHNALYMGLVPASLAPCSQGASCTDRHLDLFGFVSIPLLALVAFSAIIALLVAFTKRSPP
jgi:disulfide bond formation protein DsbB